MSWSRGVNLLLHPRCGFNVRVSQVVRKVGRVSDHGSRAVQLRSALKSRYRTQRKVVDWSVLSLRADVVLHRSGLCNSVGQARQLIKHGHVSGVRSSQQLVAPGQILRIEKYLLKSHLESSTSQWVKWLPRISQELVRVPSRYLNARLRPLHLEVDYSLGAVCVVRRAVDNEVRCLT